MAPSDAPPPYTEHAPPSHKTRNGIPPQRRRSMEDEARPLPPGWIRQYDDEEHHQFFVDTTSNPPRSIWQHPLSPEERARIAGLHRVPSEADIEAESTDEEGGDGHVQPPRGAAGGARVGGAGDNPTGLHKLGRKMKDKLTSSTHTEREQRRRQREQEEIEAYKRHQAIRAAMVKAARTGEPQLVGKDRQGREVFVEPPFGAGGGMGMGGGMGGVGGRYGNNAYGYNPYMQGPYSYNGARYMRPQGPYNRPYGGGYGGGLGVPLMGGLLGGAVLGGLLF
ncbi:ww rsp5 wwp protein [Rutstroemia sp. NJR-2017a WRK4]|nr:ww rsp5 wwp protein [Rutstroemia sp. NJR-2017a WRK4]